MTTPGRPPRALQRPRRLRRSPVRAVRRAHELPPGFRVLSLLDEHGPLGITALAALDRSSQPTMSGTVAGLAGRGLVDKQPNPADARGSVVTLTDLAAASCGACARRTAPAVADPLHRPPGTTPRGPRHGRRRAPRPPRHRPHEGNPVSTLPAPPTTPLPRPDARRLPDQTARRHGGLLRPAARGMGGGVRVRDRLHGDRPGRPDPPADRRRSSMRRPSQVSLLSPATWPSWAGDARHRRRLEPHRCQAHPAGRAGPDHRLLRLAGRSDSIGAIVGFRAGWGLGNALFIATALADHRRRRARLGGAGDHPVRGRARPRHRDRPAARRRARPDLVARRRSSARRC